MAPLAMSLCLSLSLGWRSAVLLGAVIGGVIVLLFRHVPIADPADLPATERATAIPSTIRSPAAAPRGGTRPLEQTAAAPCVVRYPC
jgi:hypothetical protein